MKIKLSEIFGGATKILGSLWQDFRLNAIAADLYKKYELIYEYRGLMEASVGDLENSKLLDEALKQALIESGRHSLCCSYFSKASNLVKNWMDFGDFNSDAAESIVSAAKENLNAMHTAFKCISRQSVLGGFFPPAIISLHENLISLVEILKHHNINNRNEGNLINLRQKFRDYFAAQGHKEELSSINASLTENGPGLEQ